MKNSSTSTWILILIAIGLLVVAWYMSVTKDVLTPAQETQNMTVQTAAPVTSNVQSSNTLTPSDTQAVQPADSMGTSGQNRPVNPQQSSENSAQALESAVEFEGTLPCADCPGIVTTLTLYPNQTYQLDTVYIDRDSSFTSKGSWKYDTNPPRYVLMDDRQQYQILDDNTLQALDQSGNPIESAANYTLKRVTVTQED